MALLDLPNELLDEIVYHALPEGFEGLALTCKRLSNLCKPFVAQYNYLRSQLENLELQEFHYPPILQFQTAFDLIKHIAVEPIAARYIRNPNFRRDNYHNRIAPHREDTYDDPALVRLLSNSLELKEAGLDWREYYDKIKEARIAGKYSQHAAAFLLTLLPNVESLVLPSAWAPVEATRKLIEIVLRKANQSRLPGDTPGLGQMSKLKIVSYFGRFDWVDLRCVFPFLGLPHLRHINGMFCKLLADRDSMMYDGLSLKLGETLEYAEFTSCDFDEGGITLFLKHAKRLETLIYLHTTEIYGTPQYWDLCQFIMAIGREAGDHLKTLAVSLVEDSSQITPGRVKMHDFKRLQHLRIPLEVYVCNHDSNVLHGIHDVIIPDLIPASVSHLTLGGREIADHSDVLEAFFNDLTAVKTSRLPFLTDVHSFHRDRSTMHERLSDRLVAKAETAGINLHVHSEVECWPEEWKEQ